MAATTQQFLSVYGGLIAASVTFDDVTGAISTVTITNNGAPGPVTVTLGAYGGGDLWTRTIQPAAGTVAHDVSALNVSMVKNSKGIWIPPYTVAASAG